MKKNILFSALVIFASFCTAQVAQDYAVMVNAKVDTLTPSVTLKWKPYASATSYTIYKKTKDATGWGSAIATLGGTDSIYTEINVGRDTAYEYKIQRAGNSITAYGYIYAGIAYPAREKRGTLILLVDSTFSDSLSNEIQLLMEDISCDGWAVVRHDVSRNEDVEDVKALVVADYNADPLNVKGLFILGHVPVPYSGDINPDGHPDHKGAWPADAFYADVNGTWTDVSINDTVASRMENRNIPGDGKYDQSTIPSLVELMTGRADFYNMPAFGVSETVMMRRYLARDHAFRNSEIQIQDGAVIDDNFGAFGGEAFAANAWKNFPTMFADTAITAGDFFGTLNNQPHLWSYACGGGNFTGASGVGSTIDFATDSVLSIFTMIFGSYLGDWDSQNNFLRAPLASKGLPLTCCWAGRPHWQFHHMAIGEPVGYAAKWAMNNASTYFANYGARFVHIALMGDPSLRQHYVAPPQLVTANPTYPVEITWDSSPDSVDGYYVYRSSTEFGVYDRITSGLVTGNVFYDSLPNNGMNYYMVRAIEYTECFSGSYINISTGKKDTTFIDLSGIKETPEILATIFPNPSNGAFTVYLSETAGSGITAEIFDLQGREVFTDFFASDQNNSGFRINTGLQEPGIYLLKLSSSKGTVVKRINIFR